jgi:peptidyl-prolyl cis-trans isomerase SurA
MKLFRLVPVLALALCPVLRVHADMVDGVMAVINDAVITRQQVELFVAPAIESLRREYAGQPDAFDQKLTGVINDGLEQLVERQLILHDFDVEGYHLPDSVVDDLVQQRIRERFSDRVTLMKTLQAQGHTFEEFRKDVRDQYIVTALRAKNVSQEIVVSPNRVGIYYLAHQDDFKVEDEVKLRMITLNKASAADTDTVKLAHEIQAQIQAGAAFEDMAKVY